MSEACPLNGATGTDVNGDGRPDVYELRRGSKRVCRAMDLDFDGQVDVVELFDDSGTRTQRLSDLDGNGTIDSRQ